jgi:hypothetical protein
MDLNHRVGSALERFDGERQVHNNLLEVEARPQWVEYGIAKDLVKFDLAGHGCSP